MPYLRRSRGFVMMPRSLGSKASLVAPLRFDISYPPGLRNPCLPQPRDPWVLDLCHQTRFNRSLYLAEDAETAHREGNSIFYRTLQYMYGGGIGYDQLLPPEESVLIGVMVIASRLLNLRDSSVQARLQTSPQELGSAWKTVMDAPTQRLGEAVLINGGFEGLIYESVQCPNHTCLVMFPELLSHESRIVFHSRTIGVSSVSITSWGLLPSEA